MQTCHRISFYQLCFSMSAASLKRRIDVVVIQVHLGVQFYVANVFVKGTLCILIELKTDEQQIKLRSFLMLLKLEIKRTSHREYSTLFNNSFYEFTSVYQWLFDFCYVLAEIEQSLVITLVIFCKLYKNYAQIN